LHEASESPTTTRSLTGCAEKRGSVKNMRYFLYAVEKETGFVFEREVSSPEEYAKFKSELENEGYGDFYLQESWEDEEMWLSLSSDENEKE